MAPQRPGERRRRDRSSAPAKPVKQDVGPIVIATFKKGDPRPKHVQVDPAKFGSQSGLARDLLTDLKVRFDNGSHASLHKPKVAIYKFLEVCASHDVCRWDQLTRSILEELEQLWVNDQGQARFIWWCLRRVRNGPNGKLTDDVTKFVRSDPNVPKRRNRPTEGLPAGTVRDILRAAINEFRSVSTASSERAGTESASRRMTLSFAATKHWHSSSCCVGSGVNPTT